LHSNVGESFQHIRDKQNLFILHLSYFLINLFIAIIFLSVSSYELYVCVRARVRVNVLIRRKLLLYMYFTRRAQKHGVFRLISEILRLAPHHNYPGVRYNSIILTSIMISQLRRTICQAREIVAVMVCT